MKKTKRFLQYQKIHFYPECEFLFGLKHIYIFVLFVFAILSDIEMDQCFHEKDTECDESNDNKDGSHFYYI